MRRLLLPVLVALLFAATDGPLWGQRSSGLIPTAQMERYGLRRAWYAQVELDSAVARLAHVTQHVSNTIGTTFVDVVLVDREQQKLATYTDRQLDAFGKPLGPEGAKQAATEKVAELAALGVAAKAVTHVVPEITLYLTTDNGFMHAIDGETGATRWVVPVGDSDFPTYAPAANDHFVAAINGIRLYVYDARDGRLVWTRRLAHAPGAGPAVSQDYVHVPMVPGLMESYYLADPSAPPRVYQSFGRAILQPTVTPESLIWATDRGFMYVANADRPGVRFRLETTDEIVARPAWSAPNRVIGVSLDGDVYAMNEFTGALSWRFSTGDPIGHRPIALGDDVYVITNNHTLFRLSAQTGGVGAGAVWSTPGVSKFLAASGNRIYCSDHLGRFLVIHRPTGGRIASLPLEFMEVSILNEQTDRIFFANKFGLIQCFHEIQLDYPILHVGAGTEAPKEAPEVKQEALPAEPKAPPMGAPADADPFGGGADPFGGGADPFGGGADPFGGGADPFNGGGGAPMNPGAAPATPPPATDDPFGGGDPFGT